MSVLYLTEYNTTEYTRAHSVIKQFFDKAQSPFYIAYILFSPFISIELVYCWINLIMHDNAIKCIIKARNGYVRGVTVADF